MSKNCQDWGSCTISVGRIQPYMRLERGGEDEGVAIVIRNPSEILTLRF
jgi:hypothetical protein